MKTRSKPASAPVRDRSEDPLGHVNEAQRRAVTHTGGPLLVIAGAGTGKTTVVTERIAWLIREHGLRPDAIAALTFTEKAAAEMEERLDRLLPLGYSSVWIATFHGFCERLLREFALDAGIDPSFRVVSTSQQWLLLRRHLHALPLHYYRPLGNPTKFLRSLLHVISSAKDEDVSPESLEQYAAGREEEAERTSDSLARDALREEAVRWREVAGVYRAYNELLVKESLLDFGDLILQTLRLFRQHPVVLAAVRERFRHVVVDEFQDTNVSQNELLRLLVGDRGDVTVVGDDDQSIYAWRGSNIANILEFQRTYERVTTVVLTENYRSSQEILDAAYRLIQHNNPFRLEHTTGIAKQLAATRTITSPARHRLSHRHFPTTEQERGFIASTILQLVEKNLCLYKECAILTRTNAQAEDIVPALAQRDIPFHVAEARGLLLRPEVRDLSSYLRAIADPFNTVPLFRLLSLPEFFCDPLTRQRLLSDARRSNRSLFDLLREPARRAELDERSREGIERFLRLLERDIARASATPPSLIALQFLQESGYLERLLADERRSAETLPNLSEFINVVTDYERTEPEASVLGVVEFLDYLLASGESPAPAGLSPDLDAVRVMTVHAAKGLEFPVVFLPGVTSDKYPVRDRTEPLELPAVFAPQEEGDHRDAHVREERRLFYVAMTRARERLYITSAERRGAQRLRRKPSPFLEEAGVPTTDASASSFGEQLTLPVVAVPVPQQTPPQLRPPRTLSVSQIETYETCPLKYQFQYVFGIPTPPSHSLSFGVTVHNVLRDLAQRTLAGQQPTIDDALQLYERSWSSAGFEDRAQEERQRDHGRNMLRGYLAAHPELLQRPPLFVEKDFQFPLQDVLLRGRIDRVDRADDGTLHVTDFKTGTPKEQRDADSNLQLSVYALALREVFHLHADVLTLSFLEGNVERHTSRTDKQLESAKKRVQEAAGRIRTGDLAPTPSLQICRMCDFRTICDASEA